MRCRPRSGTGGKPSLTWAICRRPSSRLPDLVGFAADRFSGGRDHHSSNGHARNTAWSRFAEQLKVDAAQLRSYGKRAQTRTDHLRLVAQYLGWQPAGVLEMKELDEFLLARAMEHDSPALLFRLACEYLISARVIRPGPVTVVERIAHAREQAQRETYDRLAHEFTPERPSGLDALLATDASIGMSRLRWLSTGPVEASAVAVQAEVEKLGFLRGLGADRVDMSVLPAERRRFLATMGRRLTLQALERWDPQGATRSC